MLCVRVFSVILLLCLVPHLTLADQLVLRSSDVVAGTVANRDIVAEKFDQQDAIAILVENDDGSTELRRYLMGEIAYLILENGDDKRVFDVIILEQMVLDEEGLPMRSRAELDDSRRYQGPVLIGVGSIMVAVGALVKFGDEKVTVTSSGIHYEEKSYNELNYVLMIGGGAIVLTGIVLEATYWNKRVWIRTDDNGATYVAVSYRF